QISDDAELRRWIRNFMLQQGVLISEAKDATVQSVYDMYYQYSEPVKKIVPHRVLAINRGERENFLKVKIAVDEGAILTYLVNKLVRSNSLTAGLVQDAIKDALNRLILPAVEREVR